jgi:hypothetical protein
MIPSGANFLLRLRFSLKTSLDFAAGIELRYHTDSIREQHVFL